MFTGCASMTCPLGVITVSTFQCVSVLLILTGRDKRILCVCRGCVEKDFHVFSKLINLVTGKQNQLFLKHVYLL